MTKRLSAKKKLSRKLGGNLWGNANDSFIKRNYRPGQHGASSKGRSSDYGNQLRAKQRLKFYYNVSERQFFNTFQLAQKMKGDSSENFIALLETRLDAVVYKHVLVNGEVVNIASYRLKVGDVVSVKAKSQQLALVIESTQNQRTDVPSYLLLDKQNFSIKLQEKPVFALVPYAIKMEPHLITEFYSR